MKALLREALLDFLRMYKRIPTEKELSVVCGVSVGEVRDVVSGLRFSKDSALRVLTDDVLIGIADAAKRGSVDASKLWLQLFEGYDKEKGIVSEESLIESQRTLLDVISEQHVVEDIPLLPDLALPDTESRVT